MKKRFGKLVRDKLPELLLNANVIVNMRTMDSYEFKKELMYKLIDEAEEVRKASYDIDNKKEIEKELADLLEVVDYIIKEFQLNKEEIQNYRKIKLAQKGAFNRKIFLESVEYSSKERYILDEIE